MSSAGSAEGDCPAWTPRALRPRLDGGAVVLADIGGMRDAAVGLRVTCLPLANAALYLTAGALVEALAGRAPLFVD